ncbi:adenylate/guanylate cyclase domain-containing protein, partial [Acinetobacter baumannii]
LYILPILLVFFLLSPKLEKWLQYKFDRDTEKNILFGIEAVIVAIVLAGLHLSLVPTFTILFALLYVGLNNKITLPVASLI